MNIHYYIDQKDNKLVLPSGKRLSKEDFYEIMPIPYETHTDKVQRIATIDALRSEYQSASDLS